MGYYDGNTVTALWNYAQHYAMADHLFATDYSSSAGGLIDLIAGTTQGVRPRVLPGVSFKDLLLENNPPQFDDASRGKFKVWVDRTNIGQLLSKHDVSWGFFAGGFTPSGYSQSGTALFDKRSLNSQGSLVGDYEPTSDPFQYFKGTANPHHLAPDSLDRIGLSGRANHQYDLRLLWKALAAGKLPAVSFVSPVVGQNGHVGRSSPRDEQKFIVATVNRLMRSSVWPSTAIMLVWSNSNGWYDHVTPPKAPKGMDGTGYGPRLPFVVISPWARSNFVEHSMLDQSSVLRFIEYNWGLSYLGKQTPDRYAHSLRGMFDFHSQRVQKPLLLDPNTGLVRTTTKGRDLAQQKT